MEWTGTTVTVPSGMAFSMGVGSDSTFRCQLASGASCMPASGGGMVYPGAGVPNSTGSAWGTSYSTSGTGTALALTASPVFTGTPTVPGYVATSTTVNGHALSGNVTVSATDITTGSLPHAQLPALVSGDIPNNAANTSGTAANLSGTPTLPSGTTATTQSAGDNSTKLATTAYVRSENQMAWSCPVAGTTSTVQYCNWTLPAAITITGLDLAASTAAAGCTTNAAGVVGTVTYQMQN
jgi:hypothetical protein